MIRLSNINKKVGNRQLFTNLNLEIKDSEFVVIKGKSGAGKTTLLNIIALIEAVQSGTIEYNGINLGKKNRQWYYEKEVGYLFQNYGLVENKTIYQNFKYLLSKTKMKEISKKKLNELLESFGLNCNSDSHIYNLSGGEQQRVALLRILQKDVHLILADEPTGNLDPENEKFILKELRNLADSGITIVVVSHSGTIDTFCDRIIWL